MVPTEPSSFPSEVEERELRILEPGRAAELELIERDTEGDEEDAGEGVAEMVSDGEALPCAYEGVVCGNTTALKRVPGLDRLTWRLRFVAAGRFGSSRRDRFEGGRRGVDSVRVESSLGVVLGEGDDRPVAVEQELGEVGCRCASAKTGIWSSSKRLGSSAGWDISMLMFIDWNELRKDAVAGVAGSVDAGDTSGTKSGVPGQESPPVGESGITNISSSATRGGGVGGGDGRLSSAGICLTVSREASPPGGTPTSSGA
jgi:hypothetical protein